MWLSESFFVVGRAVDASAEGLRAIISNWVPADILQRAETYRVDVHAQTDGEFGCVAKIRHFSRDGVGVEILTPLPRLLIVDDDRVVCELLTTYFASKGYRVTEAATAADAFTVVRRDCPDLVLLDIGLPHANGLTALKRLRREHPGIGVIMITGTHDPALARVSRQMGATDYVCKPFDLERLDRIVTSTLRTSKPVDLWAALR